MSHIKPISKKQQSAHFTMNIIDEFNEKETYDWDDMNMGQNNPLCYYYNVPQTSEEGERITKFILNNCTSPSMCKIKKIERIQNPYLMASFLIKKHFLEQESGSHRVQSRYLLHGTHAKNVDSIATHNFDLNLVKRNKHGLGINFTPDVAFASLFGDRSIKKVVIVANVLQAFTCEGNENMVIPPNNCDTTITKCGHNRKIIVKYDDDTFYPAYRVTYNL